jgi:pimeloyl-ACP methyl ester carboxylesterase
MYGPIEVDVKREVLIPSGGIQLAGELRVPKAATGLVLFVHGSGSSRHSPRNQYVARTLNEARIGTLLFDLLTPEEEDEEEFTRHLRFNIGLLARRLVDATRWLLTQREIQTLPVGFFGASTGAAAALVAAADLGQQVAVVVSRGGRPDLAGAALTRVEAPTLLIVGGHDKPVIKLNWDAYALLHCEKRVKIVDGATHLFEEPGALEAVAQLAAEWFTEHFRTKSSVAAQQMKA